MKKLYTHILLPYSKHGDVHLGGDSKPGVKQAHTEGETSEEIYEWISTEDYKKKLKELVDFVTEFTLRSDMGSPSLQTGLLLHMREIVSKDD